MSFQIQRNIIFFINKIQPYSTKATIVCFLHFMLYIILCRIRALSWYNVCCLQPLIYHGYLQPEPPHDHVHGLAQDTHGSITLSSFSNSDYQLSITVELWLLSEYRISITMSKFLKTWRLVKTNIRRPSIVVLEGLCSHCLVSSRVTEDQTSLTSLLAIQN